MNALVKAETRALSAMPEHELIDVLQSSLYPGANASSIKMVMGYCRAAGLDPMQKPVHIVPMWDKNTKSMRDVIMPGVNLYRTQAMRSGECAGVSEPEFGPDVTAKLSGVDVTYPQWCRVTVKRRLPTGEVVDFTAREFWLENYATAGKDSGAPNAMWKKRPYGQIAKCFDEQTEVLTTKGFERFESVTGSILQVTPGGLSPCDARPFVQEYDGEMIVADGTRLNFAVTPNHDMLTTDGKIEAGDLFDRATKVSGKFSIPRAPAASTHEADIPDGALRLVGYFMADGSHTGHRQFRIAVSRQYKIDALRELALHQRESVKSDAGRVAVTDGRAIVTQSDKVVFTYDFALVDRLVSTDKSINVAALLQLSTRQARIVVDAVLEFDGHTSDQGVRRLTQTNQAVLAGFEIAAIHAGLSVSVRTDRVSDLGTSQSITVSEADHFPVVRGVQNNSASLVKRINASGRVWCVTVPSGVIVVRRKGFSMLCGNCAEAQALRKAFPEIAAQPTAEEMEGKSMHVMDTPDHQDGAAWTEELIAQAKAASESGSHAYATFWKGLSASLRNELVKTAEHAGFKAASLKADEKRTVDAPVKQAAQQPGTKTFEEVMAMLCQASNIDALNVASDWVREIDNADHQELLMSKYEERAAEMGGAQ